jgi:predicted XRE-type DNA-binding protein
MRSTTKKMATMSENIVTRSSGNVFADLGLPNPEDRRRKAILASRIGRTIAARGLTQSAAARIACVAQPDLSKMIRGQVSGFSMGKLFDVLVALGNDVKVVVKEREDHSAGAIQVELA